MAEEFREGSPIMAGVRVILAIVRVTFTEIAREKVLYNILLAAFVLFGVGFLASKLTFVQPGRVILDFGYSALNLSSTVLAILAGAAMIGKELEHRTIHVALSHPISTLQFVVGKFAGLGVILFLNWFLLAGVYVVMLWGLNGALNLSFTFLSALGLVLIQAWVMGGLALLFSCVSTTSLSVILTVGMYLIGINHSELRLLSGRTQSEVGKMILDLTATWTPNLEYFNLGNKLTYDLPVSWAFVGTSVAYGMVIMICGVMLSGVLVRWRGL